jgi:DNA-binding CsgD family transcriptional regulator
MSWVKYRQYVELLSKVNSSCVFLLEYNRRYLYTSPNFHTFFGYDVEKLNDPFSIEENYMEERIHPEDASVFETIQKRLVGFWYSQPIECRKDYKYIFELRILNANGDYVRVISQHQVLETDEEGNPYLVLGVADLSPDNTSSGRLKFRLVNMKTGEIVPFPLSEDCNENLTKREIEILKLVNQGMLSKEISDYLSISLHTVNNHRQNILQKLNANNVVEAINSARQAGLLD